VKDDVHTGRDDGGWQRNVVIDRVEAGGCAHKAGLQRGDVVVRAGELAVNSSLDLERGFLEHIAGDRIPMVVKRNGVEQKTDLATFNPMQFYILRNGKVHHGTLAAE